MAAIMNLRAHLKLRLQCKLKMLGLFLATAIGAAALPAVVHAQGRTSDELTADKLNLQQDIEAIDFHWAGHRVNAQMIQRGEHQFVVYYDASRQMSIAHRTSVASTWRYHKLPSFVGWDSHNYATIDVDEDGYIHVMGNMHADPLIYFRSTRPWDIRTLEKVDFMIDPKREMRVTYPRFLHDASGRLLAIYRLGGSGNGNYYYHRYDSATKSWSLLHGKQFFDGENERGSYYQGPEMGPDGLFHMIWVWRETPSAATNNNLSYVRSRDLINWEDSNGKPVSLPIVRSKGEIVDPVPPFGGILNGQTKLGFDAQKRPIISYYKHDARGDTQIMLARKSGTGWTLHQISNWTASRRDLDKGGSLTVDIMVPEGPFVAADGSIRVRVRFKGENQEFVVDPKTNKTLRVEKWQPYPAQVGATRDNPALTLQVRQAEGVPASSKYDYYLSWEANSSFQDRARPDIPDPVVLRLHRVAR